MSYLFAGIKTKPRTKEQCQSQQFNDSVTLQTINNLRRQNQYLKQKLDVLTKVAVQTPRASESMAFFSDGQKSQLLTRNKSWEDDHFHKQQNGFCNNGQTNHVPNSLRAFNERLFNSPSQFSKGVPSLFEKLHCRREEVPLIIAHPKVKMMVIGKDKDGRYFRNREVENKLKALHSAQSDNRPNPDQFGMQMRATTVLSPKTVENAKMGVQTNGFRCRSPTFLRSLSKTHRLQQKQNKDHSKHRLVSPRRNVYAKMKDSQMLVDDKNVKGDYYCFYQSTAEAKREQLNPNQDVREDMKRGDVRQQSQQFFQADRRLSIEQHLEENMQQRPLNNRKQIRSK